MLSPRYRSDEVEVHGRPLYPKLMEIPELRWAYIRKVYVLLTLQLLLAVAVTAAVVFVPPISHFFTGASSVVRVFVFTPYIVVTPLYHYYQSNPVNYIILAIYTVWMSIEMGLASTYATGQLILEAVVLTAALVVIFTLFTLWVARRGRDYFTGAFLFAGLLLHILIHLQMYYPLGKLKVMFFGCLQSLILTAHIVYDTDYLIKRYSYNGSIGLVVAFYRDCYKDLINRFLSQLTAFRAADSRGFP